MASAPEFESSMPTPHVQNAILSQLDLSGDEKFEYDTGSFGPPGFICLCSTPHARLIVC